MSTYAAARYRIAIVDRTEKSRAYTAANREKKAEYNSRYMQENKARVRAQRKTHRAENKELIADAQRKWQDKSRDWMQAYRRTYWAANKDRLREERKPYFRQNTLRVRAEDPGYFARKASARRAAELRATPLWADEKLIAEFYETAAGLGMWTGEWYHVDHIVPLRGRTVCGLHVRSNLQVLPRSENISKSNRHWPDQP